MSNAVDPPTMDPHSGEDSEDDDDIIGVGEEFQKHLDALKRACVLEVSHSGYISTAANLLASRDPQHGGEIDDEDDDELLRSIEKKFGSLSQGGSTLGKVLVARDRDKKQLYISDDEEEDDEELLRSVERLYNRPVPSLKDNANTNPCQSLARSTQCSSPLQIGPGTAARVGDVGVSSAIGRTSCETGSELVNEVEGAATSQLPGNWIETACDTDSELPEEAGQAVKSFLPGNWSDGGYDTCSETNDEVGKAITSLLPGNWSETNEDVGPDTASSPLLSTVVAVQHGRSAEKYSSSGNQETTLPENQQIVADALKKNRRCQRTLSTILSQINARKTENADMQKRVRTLVDFEKYCKRRFAGFFADPANPNVKLIAIKGQGAQSKTSETRDKLGSDAKACGPPPNSDVEIFKRLQKKVPFSTQGRRWTDEERKDLAKGVKQQVYKVLVQQAMEAFSAETLEEDLDDHIRMISERELAPREIREAASGVNWAEVATLYVEGRTSQECRSRWMNHEDSVINKAPWTKTEDKRLLSIAQRHEFSNWEIISRELGSNRTPADCLSRYQRSLNSSIMRSTWTPEEDTQLRSAIEEFGTNDWSTVAACLEGRTNSQCLMRWFKVLHPTKKKNGRWSVEEDKRLKWAVSVYGPKRWKQIAEHVPGRTDLQCRERWCNVLDPSIKLGQWTEEEDKKLESSVAVHGQHHWAAVANDLKIRTDNQCWRRWKLLHPEHQTAFQRSVYIRRTALGGNFQGRRKDRSNLGPQDFISKVFDLEDKTVADNQTDAVHPSSQSTSVDESRKRRAFRIQKRKLARAKLQKQVPAVDIQTRNELNGITNPGANAISTCQQERDVLNGDLRRSVRTVKRKAGSSLGLVKSSTSARQKVSRCRQNTLQDSITVNLQTSGELIDGTNLSTSIPSTRQQVSNDLNKDVQTKKRKAHPSLGVVESSESTRQKVSRLRPRNTRQQSSVENQNSDELIDYRNPSTNFSLSSQHVRNAAIETVGLGEKLVRTRKGKASPSIDPIEPTKQKRQKKGSTNIARCQTQNILQDAQPVGPEIPSFVDTVVSTASPSNQGFSAGGNIPVAVGQTCASFTSEPIDFTIDCVVSNPEGVSPTAGSLLLKGQQRKPDKLLSPGSGVDDSAPEGEIEGDSQLTAKLSTAVKSIKAQDRNIPGNTETLDDNDVNERPSDVCGGSLFHLSETRGISSDDQGAVSRTGGAATHPNHQAEGRIQKDVSSSGSRSPTVTGEHVVRDKDVQVNKKLSPEGEVVGTKGPTCKAGKKAVENWANGISGIISTMVTKPRTTKQKTRMRGAARMRGAIPWEKSGLS